MQCVYVCTFSRISTHACSSIVKSLWDQESEGLLSFLFAEATDLEQYGIILIHGRGSKSSGTQKCCRLIYGSATECWRTWDHINQESSLVCVCVCAHDFLVIRIAHSCRQFASYHISWNINYWTVKNTRTWENHHIGCVHKWSTPKLTLSSAFRTDITEIITQKSQLR